MIVDEFVMNYWKDRPYTNAEIEGQLVYSHAWIFDKKLQNEFFIKKYQDHLLLVIAFNCVIEKILTLGYFQSVRGYMKYAFYSLVKDMILEDVIQLIRKTCLELLSSNKLKDRLYDPAYPVGYWIVYQLMHDLESNAN